jgi:hypothetical protein
MGILPAVFFFLRGFLLSHSALAAENLALRQQVAVYQHSVKRSKLRLRDRVFWVLLCRLWPNWKSALAIVWRKQYAPVCRNRSPRLLGLLQQSVRAFCVPLVYTR